MKSTPADSSKSKSESESENETAPNPASSKADVNWKDAVKAALAKKREPEGWPKSPSTKHKGGKS